MSEHGRLDGAPTHVAFGNAGLGVERSNAVPTADEARAVFDAFHRIMQRAATDGEIGERLAFAQVVTHVHLRDAPEDLTMTLLFDRAPVEVADRAVGHPDVELWIDTNDVVRFWTGDMHLAMGIMHGEVEFKGPVRKLLRIVPIVRRLFTEFRAMAVNEQLAVPGPQVPSA